MSVNKTTLVKHSNTKHPNQKPSMEVLSPDDATETWIFNVLKTQTDLIKKGKADEEAVSETASTSEQTTHIEISLDSEDDDVRFESSVQNPPGNFSQFQISNSQKNKKQKTN